MSEFGVTVAHMAIFFGVIIMDAVARAVRDDDEKEYSNALQFIITTTLIVAICFLGNNGLVDRVERIGSVWLFGGYLCLRYALFYTTYCVARGLVPHHRGKTKRVRMIM